MCVQRRETSESSKFLAALNERRAHRQCCFDKIRTRRTARKNMHQQQQQKNTQHRENVCNRHDAKKLFSIFFCIEETLRIEQQHHIIIIFNVFFIFHLENVVFLSKV